VETPKQRHGRIKKEQMNQCAQCSWTGTNDELSLTTYPNGGDDTLCPKCGGRVEEMLDEHITHINASKEFLKDPDNIKMINKMVRNVINPPMEKDKLIEKIAISHQRQMASVHPKAIIETIVDAINEYERSKTPASNEQIKADLRRLYKKYDGSHYIKLLDAIEQYILTSLTAPVDGITLNELGDFVDWINKTNFKQYPAGWCQAGGSNGWHCTTQELINFFKIRTKSTNP
jgi:hypothetical protein